MGASFERASGALSVPTLPDMHGFRESEVLIGCQTRKEARLNIK
jgi:hypothetical protein